MRGVEGEIVPLLGELVERQAEQPVDLVLDARHA